MEDTEVLGQFLSTVFSFVFEAMPFLVFGLYIRKFMPRSAVYFIGYAICTGLYMAATEYTNATAFEIGSEASALSKVIWFSAPGLSIGSIFLLVLAFVSLAKSIKLISNNSFQG